MQGLSNIASHLLIGTDRLPYCSIVSPPALFPVTKADFNSAGLQLQSPKNWSTGATPTRQLLSFFICSNVIFFLGLGPMNTC